MKPKDGFQGKWKRLMAAIHAVEKDVHRAGGRFKFSIEQRDRNGDKFSVKSGRLSSSSVEPSTGESNG